MATSHPAFITEEGDEKVVHPSASGAAAAEPLG
jgi:hypothetical protein